MKKKIIITIQGPTGSGKSSASRLLALKINGEIINSDSRNFFKEANIGTAKVQYDDVKIHLINIIKLGDSINAFQFQKKAIIKIKNIFAKSKIPIVVGGSGLYTDVLRGKIKLSKYSNTFNKIYIKNKTQLINTSVSDLQKLFCKFSNAEFNILNNSEKFNRHRLIRKIAILMTKTESKGNTIQLYTKGNFNDFYQKAVFLNYALCPTINTIKENISLRLDQMFQEGLLKEFFYLYRKYGVCEFLKTTIGYKEFIDILCITENINRDIFIEEYEKKAEEVKDEIRERIYLDTTHYAKRQITWIKRLSDTHIVNNTDDLINEIIREVIKFKELT